jgi:hypothetical protein
LANVRSVIVGGLAAAALVAMLAAATLWPESSRAQDEDGRRVVVAVLPYGTTVTQIAKFGDLAPGVISAGLGPVSVAQTFLDVGQGNRVNQKLYDGDLPRLYVSDGRVPTRLWERTLRRAESAPADIDPGLLGSTLGDAGIPVAAEDDSGLSTLMAVNRAGAVRIVGIERCVTDCGDGLSVMRARLRELRTIAMSIGPDDLLIAIAVGQPAEQELLPAGIKGPGFEEGNLTSASTRTEGIVSSIDLAPTILEHFGVEVPSEVKGAEITTSGERDAEAVDELQAQLDTRPSRELVALLPLAIWLAACGVAALIGRRRAAAVALRHFALACAWAPLTLLAAAAVDASTLASALGVGLGSLVLALASDRLVGGWAALALACAVTVGAYAVDVVTGSSLTALSVLGPNPGAGVRFFGIGNELEAILTPLALIGAGAWLSTRRNLAPGTAAIWFGAIAALAAAAFAPGRFGADVGAAIVLGVGGATAAVLALGLERRKALAVVVGGGVLGLAALFAVDAALGGAHLSRSVLGAGEAGDLLDVLDRRLTLMFSTFTAPVYPELLALTVVLLAVGIVRRDAVLGWFGDAWPARCGFLGALVGILVGSVANDSGSVLLVIGMIYLGATAAFAWALGPRQRA